MSQSKSKLARALETIADLRRQLKQQAGTPSSTWAATGEPDPHGDRYNCERAELALGDLTDDQLANGAFMNYDRPLDINAILNAEPGYHSPIAWMTAVKDRIRWLSRKLEEQTQQKALAAWPAPHILIGALEKIAREPGCGCSFPCQCGGEERAQIELDARMDLAAQALAKYRAMSAQAVTA